MPALVITNIDDAFGLTLPYRSDWDGDGFPDVLGPIAPTDRSRERR